MEHRYPVTNILLAASLSTLAVIPALLLALPWLIRLVPDALPGPGWMERIMVVVAVQIAAFMAMFVIGVPVALVLNYFGRLRLYTLLLLAIAVAPFWMLITGSPELTTPLLLAYLAVAVVVTFWGILIRVPARRRARRIYPVT